MRCSAKTQHKPLLMIVLTSSRCPRDIDCDVHARACLTKTSTCNSSIESVTKAAKTAVAFRRHTKSAKLCCQAKQPCHCLPAHNSVSIVRLSAVLNRDATSVPSLYILQAGQRCLEVTWAFRPKFLVSHTNACQWHQDCSTACSF